MDPRRRALQVLLLADLVALVWLVWTPADTHRCDATTSLIGQAFCLNPGLTLLGNILLLVPTAVLLQLLYPRFPTTRLALGMLATACLIEFVQFYIPGRDPSLLDVFENAGGAALALSAMPGFRDRAAT